MELDLPPPEMFAPVKAAPDTEFGEHWPIIYKSGNSQDDGNDWHICTDGVRASELMNYHFPIDAKSDAEIIANLINAYRTGKLVPVSTL